MEYESLIVESARSALPLQALRSSLIRLLREGHDRTSLLVAFGVLADELRGAGREAEADLTLEGMDLLSDWCSPHMRLDAPASQG
jgi:hypothetical protein